MPFCRATLRGGPRRAAPAGIASTAGGDFSPQKTHKESCTWRTCMIWELLSLLGKFLLVVFLLFLIYFIFRYLVFDDMIKKRCG